MTKVKTYYINQDIECGPYYEALFSARGKDAIQAEGKTERFALLALKAKLKSKIKEALKTTDCYKDLIDGIDKKLNSKGKTK